MTATREREIAEFLYKSLFCAKAIFALMAVFFLTGTAINFVQMDYRLFFFYSIAATFAFIVVNIIDGKQKDMYKLALRGIY